MGFVPCQAEASRNGLAVSSQCRDAGINFSIFPHHQSPVKIFPDLRHCQPHRFKTFMPHRDERFQRRFNGFRRLAIFDLYFSCFFQPLFLPHECFVKGTLHDLAREIRPWFGKANTVTFFRKLMQPL